jgi:citrate lyase subunit beta/citryl-CoA lyase
MAPAANQPRRSALYMPGANPRALEKGKSLAADVLILDLEDGVLPAAKVEARERVAAAVRAGGYGRRELAVRINGLGTEWYEDDVRTAARAGPAAVLVPKVDGPDTVRRTAALLDAAGAAPGVRLWCMIETPLGVLNVRDIASASPRLDLLTLGTADLSKELHADLHAPDRLPLLPAIGLCILAARAHGLAILDAPHFDLDDDAGFERACRQGRALGFDGKCLLHPKTIAVANAVFGPSAEEVAWARRIAAAWREAAAAGKGVTLVDGKLIEALHVAEAERTLALADEIAARQAEARG